VEGRGEERRLDEAPSQASGSTASIFPSAEPAAAASSRSDQLWTMRAPSTRASTSAAPNMSGGSSKRRGSA
jgi:hypothetical protein